MNQQSTASIIKKLRESKKITQQQLADKLCVSDKTISKWETGKGFPDITLIEPLASAYTQSNNPVGRPTKPVEEKSPKTLQNEESLNNQ